MKIGVILPTISKRSAVYRQTFDAYARGGEGVDLEINTITDVSPLGDAWNLGASELEDCDYLHFAVDDALPELGWVEGALAVASDRYTIASPRLTYPNGQLEYCGSMGFGQVLGDCPTGTPCRVSSLPFVSQEGWQDVGPFMSAHYYVDDDWCWRAAVKGYKIRVARGYHLVHLGLKEASLVQHGTQDKMMFLYRCMGVEQADAAPIEVSDAA